MSKTAKLASKSDPNRSKAWASAINPRSRTEKLTAAPTFERDSSLFSSLSMAGILLLGISVISPAFGESELDYKTYQQLRISDQTIRDFERIVSLDMGDGSTFQRIMRWKRNIRLAVILDAEENPNDKSNDAGVSDVFYEVTNLFSTKIPLEITKNKANIILVLTDNVFDAATSRYRHLFDKLFPKDRPHELDNFVNSNKKIKNDQCFGYQRANSTDLSIFLSMAFIRSTADENVVKKCIVAELLRSVGLVGVSKSPNSALNPYSTTGGLSDTDRTYFYMLYDENVDAGDEISEVIKYFRERP